MTFELVEQPGRLVDQPSRSVLSTRRREEAGAILARTFPDIRLEPVESDGPFMFRHTAFTDGRITSTELILTGAVTATGSIARGEVGVGTVIAGRYSAEYGRHRVDPDRPFLRPATHAVVRMQDAHVRLVTFDTEALRVVGERLEATGAGHVRLVHSRPVSDEAAAAWRWAGAQVHTPMQDPRAAAAPHGARGSTGRRASC